MDFTKQPNITIFKHPLIKHKISLLRDKEASTNKFRTLIEEIAMLEAYEALSDLPLKEVEVETPLEKCKTPMLDGLKLMFSFQIAKVQKNMRNDKICHNPTQDECAGTKQWV